MTSCPSGEELARFLVGTDLDAPRAVSIASHLVECAACAGAIDALRELECVLRELPASRPIGWWPKVRIAAVAATVLVAVGVWIWWPAATGPLLLSGRVVADAAPVPAGSTVPCGADLQATSGAEFRLDDGVRCGVEQPAQLVIVEPTRIRLDAGTLHLAVNELRPFTVLTPRGTVVAQNARFRVAVMESDMNSKVILGGSVVAVAVVAGVVWFTDVLGTKHEVREGKTVVSNDGGTRALPDGTAVPDASMAAELQDLREASELAQARLSEVESEAATLKTELAAAKAENRDLAKRNASLIEQLRPLNEERGASLASVVARIEALKGKGLQAFLAPAATQELVSEIKKLGDAGVDAVMAMLGAKEGDERFLAAMLLEQLGDPRAIDALLDRAVKDEVELVANMSSHALALMGDRAAIPALNAIVDQTHHEGARVNALFGLCSHGDPSGIQKTIEFLADDDHSRQLKAALAGGIFVLGDVKVMPVANELVSQFKGNDTLMAMAVDFYQKVGTVEARASLQQIVSDAGFSQEVRDAAMAALNQ